MSDFSPSDPTSHGPLSPEPLSPESTPPDFSSSCDAVQPQTAAQPQDPPLSQESERHPTAALSAQTTDLTDEAMDDGLWSVPLKRLQKRFRKRPLADYFADWQPRKAADAGCCLRSGLALAQGQPLTHLQHTVSNLAAGIAPGRKSASEVEWSAAADALLVLIDEVLQGQPLTASLAMDATSWCYALPGLIDYLDLATWQTLCQSLDALARHCQNQTAEPTVAGLIGGCELPLALKWVLGEWACDRLVEQAVSGLKEWNQAGEASLAAPLVTGALARLTLASVLRQRRLVHTLIGSKGKRGQWGAAVDLACWVLALSRRDGTAVFSSLTPAELRDDWMPGGLFTALQSLSPRMLGSAAAAVTRQAVNQQTVKGGRMAWAIALPETLWHNETASIASLLPEWDVSRGRAVIDYHQSECQIEVMLGAAVGISGRWQAMVHVDGELQQAVGPWVSTTEYSDDDVQYIELSQEWSGGVTLQRQVMVLRDDRCVLLADALLRDDDLEPAQLEYCGRIPLAETATAAADPDLNEVWISDQKQRRRGLALSLQTSEWRQVRSSSEFSVTDDQHLKLTATSGQPNDNGGNVLAALWLDFGRHRFKRPRTYRQLTVADQLRIVDPDEAVAHRVQMGSEQWITYWSLRGQRNRTFLGRHLRADFYCARFHPSDGSMEDLLTVGGLQRDDEPAGNEPSVDC